MRWSHWGPALALPAVLAACDGSATAPPPPKTVVVLFDLSESTRGHEVRNAYSRDFRQVLEKVTHGDVLVGGCITDHSATELDLPVRLVLAPLDTSSSNRLVREATRRKQDQALAERRVEVRAVVGRLLEGRPGRIMSTDILGSIELSDRVFRAYPNARRFLVLFSDMVEDVPGLDFDREELTPERIHALLESERTAGRLPVLDGVHVHVVGATHRDQERFRRIRDFWFAFFRATGAHLEPEHYGTALLRFEG